MQAEGSRTSSKNKLWVKILKVLLSAVLLAAALLGVSYIVSKYGMSVTRYEIRTDKVHSRIRIVHLSDVHDSTFGENNEKLIAEVREQEPDLIMITGDLINGSSPDDAKATGLIRGLKDICPVYVSMGNHERQYEKNTGTDLTAVFEDAGAIVLDFRYEDVQVRDEQIRIGGGFGYFLPAKYLKSGEAKKKECDYLEEFQNTDSFTVFMCHMPVCWQINHSLDEWDVDLVLSGHIHGGEVIIPFYGGAYAPDYGWFPGKVYGRFTSRDNAKTLVISRGLGTAQKIPRLNNVPEIVVVDLCPAD